MFGWELYALDPEKTIGMLGNIVSPASFYLGMVVLGTGGLFYFGWPVRKWCTRSGRFTLLSTEIMDVVTAHGKDYFANQLISPLMSAPTRAKAETLIIKLNKFGIDPPPIGTGEAWHRWLPKIAGCAANGKVCEARKITVDEKGN